MADETGAEDPSRSRRDIDLVISLEAYGALRIAWSNVTLVNGRRDVLGVERRVDEVRLVPAPDRDFYLARQAYDPFTERRQPDPLAEVVPGGAWPLLEPAVVQGRPGHRDLLRGDSVYVHRLRALGLVPHSHEVGLSVYQG